MLTPRIEVLVSPTGATNITTRGFQGPKCREATKALETALGQKQAETLTTEYHSNATEEASIAERSTSSG